MMNSPVPIPNTPSNLLPASSQRASQQPEKDDGGPFKVEMVHRMEGLAKGERIIPPCDRCRRLHMDCLKNLTACVGCTKKHAKCSWKEVKEGELRGGYTYPPGTTSNGQSETSDHESGDRASTGSPAAMMSPSHHVPTPSHISHSNGQHTPQHQQAHHQPSDQHTQPPPPQRDGSHDARVPSGRTPHMSGSGNETSKPSSKKLHNLALHMRTLDWVGPKAKDLTTPIRPWLLEPYYNTNTDSWSLVRGDIRVPFLCTFVA